MLGIRLEDELDHKLTAIAKERGLTKSDLVREAIRRFLDENELASEARRQSLVASASIGEAETLEYIEHTTDREGWK